MHIGEFSHSIEMQTITIGPESSEKQLEMLIDEITISPMPGFYLIN